jgi:integrase
MRDRDRYLKCRSNRFYYYRRVPLTVAHLDPRGTIRIALKTTNVDLARMKRDQIERADSLYWEGLRSGNRESAFKRYHAAVTHAVALGFSYAPAPEIAEAAPITEVLQRIDVVPAPRNTPVAQAVLGHAPRPRLTITEAFDVYVNEIEAPKLTGKSPGQYENWLAPKKRAVAHFIDVVGNLALEDITRENARTFYQWWLARVIPPAGSNAEPLSPESAKRDLGNMRKLFAAYTAHIGKDNLPNPFRNFSFSIAGTEKRHPFPTNWIAERILAADALAGLNNDARLIVYAMIETGARPSEIANLLPEQIFLDAPVPYISIRNTDKREVKTKPSIREIPLLGISLAAMQCAKRGFPRYYDRGNALSATLSKYFRTNGLFPSEQHVIYSFRHSFEKRMTEAGLDFGLRCVLMGHSTKRPVYGDGGSMAYRRDQLAKITLPFSPSLLEHLHEPSQPEDAPDAR